MPLPPVGGGNVPSLRLLLASLLVLVACRDSATDDPDATAQPGADAAFSYPAPRTDVVPRVGSDGTVDIATWNIQNFPKAADTPELVADLIASMDLDLVAVQEVEDIDAFDELVARLRGYDGILSTHTYGNGTYQKLGYIFRRSLLEVEAPTLLLTNNGYELPRPPLQTTISVSATGVDFTAITVHMKAGFDAEDRDRREAATVLLEEYVAGQVAGAGDADVLILGDFNEILTSAGGRAVLAPWLDAPSSYDMLTQELADAGDTSFIPSGIILDHQVSTTALADELAGGAAQIPPLDDQFLGYRSQVSDHLPVVVSMPIL